MSLGKALLDRGCTHPLRHIRTMRETEGLTTCDAHAPGDARKRRRVSRERAS